MNTTINCVVFTSSQGVINLLPVQFQANGQPPIKGHNIYYQLFRNGSDINANQDHTRRFCDIVEENLNVFQHPNNNNEKLAITIVDGVSDLGVNLLAVSNEFFTRGIIWIIIAVEHPVPEIFDLYNRSTYNTGGTFMLLSNASVILENIILSVVNGEDTLQQACRHVHIENVDTMVNHTELVDNAEDLMFDHGLSE